AWFTDDIDQYPGCGGGGGGSGAGAGGGSVAGSRAARSPKPNHSRQPPSCCCSRYGSASCNAQGWYGGANPSTNGKRRAPGQPASVLLPATTHCQSRPPSATASGAVG